MGAMCIPPSKPQELRNKPTQVTLRMNLLGFLTEPREGGTYLQRPTWEVFTQQGQGLLEATQTHRPTLTQPPQATCTYGRIAHHRC